MLKYWLTPWGYTADLPEDYDQMVKSIEKKLITKIESNVFIFTQYALAAEAVAALTAVYGTEYIIGSGTVILCN